MSIIERWRILFFTQGMLFALQATGCTYLFYHPTDTMYLHDPKSLDLLREEVTFQSLDGTQLAGWFFKNRKGYPQGTIIQFHGNAQNISSHFASLFWVIDYGYHLFTFDYRGYGISEGQPTPEGLHQDTLSAIQYMMVKLQTNTASQTDIVLYGQSLGGTLLLKAYPDLKQENRRRIRAVIVEGAFHDYHAMAQHFLSKSWLTYLFQPLAYLLVSNRFTPKDTLDQIAPTPLLVIHGEEDPIVPFSFGEKIFQLAREPKQFLKIPGGKHIDTFFIQNGYYRKSLLKYFKNKLI